MPEEKVTLGLRVDSREVRDADRDLEKLGRTGQQVEAGANEITEAYRRAGIEIQARVRRSEEAIQREISLERQLRDQGVQGAKLEEAMKELVGRDFAAIRADREKEEARQRGESSARAFVEEHKKVLEEGRALLQEAAVRGLITPEQASIVGREAGRAFNATMLAEIDRRRLESGEDIAPGVEVIAGSLEKVDVVSRSASVGTGRLNQALLSLLRTNTNLSPAVAQTANVLGSFAVGSGLMVGVLAGGAALSALWNELRADAREYGEELEEARKFLQGLQEQQRQEDLGPGGAAREAAATGGAEAETVLAEIRRLETELATAEVAAASLQDDISERIAATLRARLEDRRAYYQELVGEIESGERAAGDAESDADRAFGRRRAELLEEARRFREEDTREAERAAAEIARAEQQRIATITEALRLNFRRNELNEEANEIAARLLAISEDETRTLEEQVAAVQARNALMEATFSPHLQGAEALFGALGSFNEVTGGGVQFQAWAKFAKSLPETFREAYGILAGQSEEHAESVQRAWLAAIGSIGQSIGGLGQQLAGVAQAGVQIQRDPATGLKSVGFDVAAAGTAGLIGLAGSFVSELLDGSSRTDEARQRIRDALDGYWSELENPTPWEAARQTAQEQLEALAQDLILTLSHNQQLSAFQSGTAQAALGGDVSAIEALGGSEIADLFHAQLKQIEVARSEEAEALTRSWESQTLRNQGLDSEADALDLTTEYERRLEIARQNGTAGLLEAVDAWYESAQAAQAAADAERDRREAFDTRQDTLGFNARGLRLAGDERGALEQELQRDVERQIAAEQQNLTDKRIDEIEFLRRVQIILGEANLALADFDEALAEVAERAAEAARQEAFRAEQEHRSLLGEIARESGQEQAALTIQQQIRLEQALNDEKDEAYLRDLDRLFGLQQENLLKREQDRINRETAQSTASLNRELTSLGRALNAPEFFVNNRIRYGSLNQPASGSTTVSFGEIHIHADSTTTGNRVWNELQAEVKRQNGAGVEDPLFFGTV